ncbi:class I SAM-dependent methyltransferase [Kitasatospora sp. NBC_01287]|uniref:class I SAM-dependent methyltransferase n=1 Tax=Kitasatospora sp. NBC_01287 TaxID=2903573 RepID=UPI002257162F|nr:class I SAM-dependent methyltransferase [Kitasatospora sp. NBC_01287]MCX4745576.1 class I SAM-dependent methyltransferase [Kitasatospora sp. NBC_01287]
MTSNTINLFDRVADDYDEVLPFFSGFAAEFARLVPFAPGARVLDVGAGRGAVTSQALAHGCRVAAVDGAPAMVAHLAADHPGVDARVMDAQRLEFPDGSFDVVTAAFVVHLLDDPRQAVREARRVLVPGGTYAFSEPGALQAAGAADGAVTDGAAEDSSAEDGAAEDGAAEDRQAGEQGDPMRRLSAEFAQHLRPGGGRLSRETDPPALLAAAGFEDVRAVGISVDLPVPDGATLWRWSLSHGSLAFYESLPAERQAEFERRLIEAADAVADLRLRREATVWLGRAPA